MRIDLPHPWPADAAGAVALQDRLRPLADHTGPGPDDPGTVAGLDVAYAGDGGDSDALVAAAVVVLDARTLDVVETATAAGRAAFPYIPGLFAFRELPVLIEALEKLTGTPDVMLCDGQGLAHPRRFGLACHLGVITGVPTAGVAKTPFTGTYDAAALGTRRGDAVALTDAGETVGRVLRTQDGVKPVYVSTGHGIGLDNACGVALRAAPQYRLPQTTRLADRLSRDVLRAALG